MLYGRCPWLGPYSGHSYSEVGQVGNIVVGVVALRHQASMVLEEVGTKFSRAVKDPQRPVLNTQLIEHLSDMMSTQMSRAAVTSCSKSTKAE